MKILGKDKSNKIKVHRLQQNKNVVREISRSRATGPVKGSAITILQQRQTCELKTSSNMKSQTEV